MATHRVAKGTMPTQLFTPPRPVKSEPPKLCGYAGHRVQWGDKGTGFVYDEARVHGCGNPRTTGATAGVGRVVKTTVTVGKPCPDWRGR